MVECRRRLLAGFCSRTVVSVRSGRSLWPHQLRAVDSWCGQVGDGQRGTIVAACGTGKTLITAEASARVAPDEPVVVSVPTVDLLAQTAREWLGHLGRGVGRLVAVCGNSQLRQAARQAGVSLKGLEITTDPGRLAALMSVGRVTVLVTYASLPIVRAAYALHDAQRAGLLVVDEAHRTAGEVGKSWAMVHDEVAVPARRRLYATATPRIVGDGESAISMDDRKVFGPVVFRLGFADAISLGLLADYRLVVAVVTEEELASLNTDETLTVNGRPRPTRMLASQIALGRAITDYGLGRVLVFHNRIAAADHFAQTLPDAVRLLAGPQRPPRPVVGWSASGRSNFAHRARVLSALREPGPNTVVVSHARLFTEGVDVPALDGVMFDEPRSSIIDVVQGVGRTLRLGGEPGKIATIVLPVLISEAGLSDELSRRDWQIVWQVVRALRAHDERVEARLDKARRSQRPAGPGGATAVLPWLTADGPGVPAGFADRIRLRVVRRSNTGATPDDWELHFSLAEAFYTTHGHLRMSDPHLAGLAGWLDRQRTLYAAGKLSPQRVEALERLNIIWDAGEHEWQIWYAEYQRWHRQQQQDPSQPTSADLRDWWTTQRALHREGKLPPGHKEQMDALGFDWQPLMTDWTDGVEHAHAYRQQHGDLRVPSDFVCHDGYRLGEWLSDQRRAHRRGELSPAWIAELDQLGMVWDLREGRWSVGLAAARAYYNRRGHLNVPNDFVDDDGFPLGSWLSNRRSEHRRGQLSPARAAELNRLGMIWNKHRGPWAEGLAAARAYYHIHGSLDGAHEFNGFGLDVWFTNLRARRSAGDLSADQIADLDALGMNWDPLSLPSATQTLASRRSHPYDGLVAVGVGAEHDHPPDQTQTGPR